MGCVGDVGPGTRRQVKRGREGIRYERCVVDLPAHLVDADRNEPASRPAPEPMQIHRSRIAHQNLSFSHVISRGGAFRWTVVNLHDVNVENRPVDFKVRIVPPRPDNLVAAASTRAAPSSWSPGPTGRGASIAATETRQAARSMTRPSRSATRTTPGCFDCVSNRTSSVTRTSTGIGNGRSSFSILTASSCEFST